jgi:cytochrome P450
MRRANVHPVELVEFFEFLELGGLGVLRVVVGRRVRRHGLPELRHLQHGVLRHRGEVFVHRRPGVSVEDSQAPNAGGPRARRPRVPLPSGPRGTLWNTLRYLRDPYAFFATEARRHGDPFTLPTMAGPLVVTGDPELARTIFSADPGSVEPFSVKTLGPFLGERSLIMTAGERHKRDRKLLTPPFHGARMRAYGRVIVDATRAATAAWHPGMTAPVQRTTAAISLDVIVRAVFGIEEPEARDRWSDAIRRDVGAASPAIIFLGALRHDFFGLGPWARFRRARARLDALILGEIAARRGQRDSGPQGEDILSLMMAARYDDGTSMSDAELRDQLLTLLAAGHETTATALAWALYWIHRDPALLRDLRAEIAALGLDPEPDALAGLALLDATCAETLRLHPIVPDVARRLRAPMSLGRWTVPAGLGVAVVTSLLHADPKIYPRAEAFEARRFLGTKPSPFAYTPFGGGSRRCLGAAFALYEMKLVLATLLRDWELELVDRDVVPARQNITIGPRGGVHMRTIRARGPGGL